MDDDALRAMLPMGFGKKSKVAGPSRPARERSPSPAPSPAPAPAPAQQHAQHHDGGDDGLTAEERAAQAQTVGSPDDDDSDGSVDLGPEPATTSASASSSSLSSSSLPMASHVVLSSHTKPLSALSIDSSGARLVTGGYDYDVRLWDFGGMTSSFEPFKRLDEPFGSYWLHDVAWSPRNDAFLAASGTSQARLYDREGNHTATCAKGDPYLRDMKQTKGHVAHVSSCSWIDDETFVTASADSTIRIWNVETCRLGQKTAINVRSKDRGGRTKVTAHAISNTNQGRRTLAAACADGAIHIWTMATSSSASSYSKPNATVLQAHKPGTETSKIVFSRDGRTLATRGGPGDDTVKLWDLRNFKEPIAQRSGLPNDYAQTDIIFSPDEATLLTGVAGRGIEVLSRKDLSTVQTIDVPASGSSKPSVIRLAWHPRINQIFATLSTGACLVYYSPQSSIRGALLALPKTSRTRARSPSDIMDVGPIITPGSSSATERGQGISQAAKRRRMDRAAASDPRAPQRPIEGVGKGGRIGTAVNPNRAQAEDVAMLREDPREALLKYAGGEKKFTAAWQTNQPKTLYEEERKEGDDEGGDGER